MFGLHVWILKKRENATPVSGPFGCFCFIFLPFISIHDITARFALASMVFCLLHPSWWNFPLPGVQLWHCFAGTFDCVPTCYEKGGNLSLGKGGWWPLRLACQTYSLSSPAMPGTTSEFLNIFKPYMFFSLRVGYPLTYWKSVVSLTSSEGSRWKYPVGLPCDSAGLWFARGTSASW